MHVVGSILWHLPLFLLTSVYHMGRLLDIITTLWIVPIRKQGHAHKNTGSVHGDG